MTKIVTRFAPSPTGYMHIGGVRTALYAWAFARKNNGTFILRIEDTDKNREVAGSVDHIIESLKWLGIEWDEGIDIGGPNAPYLQSQRLDSYKKYAKILIEKGYAYSDPYTEGEVEAYREKSKLQGRPFLFRDHRPENPPVWDGSAPLRFKVPEIKKYSWIDLVRGELHAGEEALDDFILIKSDGYPTYNFAHIIDDLEMGVTHILRADEFISSTPKFLSLYNALGITHPHFATLPPLMATDGKKKLGKRDGAKDILEYRDEGYLPEAMMNFLAFIGWNPGNEKEIFSKDEFIGAFELSGVQHSGGGYNIDKLDWYNREYLKMLSSEEKIKYIKKFLPEKYIAAGNLQDSFFEKLSPLIIDRISKGEDIKKMDEEGEIEYFFNLPNYDSSKLVWKDSNTIETKDHIEKIIELLSDCENNKFNYEDIKALLWDYADKNGKGNVLWPTRYALSGKDKSPDPFSLIELFGKEESISRLKHAISLL